MLFRSNNLIREYTKPNEIVLDPFCGSGTTLVESKLLERNSIGTDLHPLGTFVSKVKTTKIRNSMLEKIPEFLQHIENRIDEYYSKPNSSTHDYNLFKFENIDHWFQQNVQHELSIIKFLIKTSKFSDSFKEFLLCAMSAIIVHVSNQYSETRYAAINKEIINKKTFELFKNKVLENSKRMKDFTEVASDCSCQIFNVDSRNLNVIDDNSVDFIMTSPPYANTYDYYLYHKQRMCWLDLEWRHMLNNEIGSRLRHSSRRENIDSYLSDMEKCFDNFHRVLKKGKYFVLVIGDSVIRSEKISGFDITKTLAKNTGFKIITQINYDLDKTSKLFVQAFRQKGKKEHIVLLQNT